VDFVVQETLDKKASPYIAVEAKWAGARDVMVGPLVWDAFRLAAFHRSTGATGLLLLAGTTRRLKSFCGSESFQRRRADRGHQSTPLLPLPDGGRSRALSRDDLSESARKYVCEKMDKAPAEAIPERLRCDVALHCKGDGHDAISFGAYVWQITSLSASRP
jgi:hypothetical protein